MTMTTCPDCGRGVSSRAVACPHCGRPLRDGARIDAMRGVPYEYRSERTLFGLPLVHVISGPAWLVGLRPARGIIAVGNVAVGVVAFGGVAFGLLAFGGVALGLLCVGGIALGLGFGGGGIAVGYWAIGGLAVGVQALGSLAIGAHTLHNDPELLRSVRSLLGRG